MIFGIRGNTDKPELAEVVYKLVRELDKNNIDYLIEREAASLVTKKHKKTFANNLLVKDKNIVSKSDYIISIGGDGTFLTTAKLVGNKHKPIIGVNLGKLGFLAETSPKDISKFILDITKNKYKLRERSVLEAHTSSNPKKKIYGLNEIVIHQRGSIKTIEIIAYFNGQFVNSYQADGLIIATPTGSTGYALSAGGPIVVPESGVVICVPLSPHTLTARPIILPDNGEIKIKVISKVPIVVTADGNSTINLQSPAEIDIKLADYKIRLVKPVSSSYFNVLKQKMFWGKDIRTNTKHK